MFRCIWTILREPMLILAKVTQQYKSKSKHFSLAKATAFRVAKLRNLVDKYQRFGGKPCLHVNASFPKMQGSHSCETLATISINQNILCLFPEDRNFICALTVCNTDWFLLIRVYTGKRQIARCKYAMTL
jgi:hypothetical protein